MTHTEVFSSIYSPIAIEDHHVVTPADVVHVEPQEGKLIESLMMACIEKHWSDEELYEIAEATLWLTRALTGKRRDSGEPKSTHSMHIAFILMDELGGNAQDVVGALLHDVVEETRDDASPITVENIQERFGQFMGNRIERLTNAKSSNNRDLPVQTHHKIYEFFLDDIDGIKIKLADRLHNMRTIEFLPPEKQAEIANETLEVYVPLAHALGLHVQAEELADRAVPLLVAVDQRELFGQFLQEYTDERLIQIRSVLRNNLAFQSGAIEVRKPTLYEVYIEAEGDPEKMMQVTLPANVFVTVGSLQQEDISWQREWYNTLWRSNVIANAQNLKTKGLLSEAVFLDVSRQLDSGSRRIKVPMVMDHTPLLVRFVDSENELFWKASVLDYNDSFSELHDYAVDKISRLRENFKRLSGSRTKFQTAREFQECLLKGAVVVTDQSGVTYGLTEGDTMLDAVFSIKTKLGKKLGDLHVTREGKKLDVVHLWDSVHHGDQIVIDESPVDTSEWRWLDWAHSPFARSEIRRIMKKRMKAELRAGIAQSESSIVTAIYSRGEKILDSLFTNDAKEQDVLANSLFAQSIQKIGFDPYRQYVSMIVAKELYGSVPLQFSVQGDRDQQHLANFFLSLGLGEIAVNRHKKSLLVDVVDRLARFQYELVPVVISTRNQAGKLEGVLGVIKEDGINVEFIHSHTDRRDARYLDVYIALSQKDFETFHSRTKKRLRKYLGRRVIKSIIHPPVEKK